MPYKKPERVPFQSFTEFLRSKGYTSPKLAEVLGCSPNTAMKKLRDPSGFSLRDIGRLYRKGHIPLTEIREAIKE